MKPSKTSRANARLGTKSKQRKHYQAISKGVARRATKRARNQAEKERAA